MTGGLLLCQPTRSLVQTINVCCLTAARTNTVAAGGCQHFVIHARKAWLKGVDPKKNRSVPPLRYDRVYFLCKKFPNLDFTLNGGIQTLEEAKKVLAGDWSGLLEGTLDYGQPGAADLRRTFVKGVMIGRAAANDPCVLASADSEIYGTADPDSAQNRQLVLEAYCHYLEQSDLARTSSIHTAMKPVLGIFNGMPGQRLFRYAIDRIAREDGRGFLPHEVLHGALEVVREAFPQVLEYPICRGKQSRVERLGCETEL